jgi:hypothetical protein
MAAEWLLSEVIIAIATPAFGHFEMVRPTWTRIVRWLAYLAVTVFSAPRLAVPGR